MSRFCIKSLARPIGDVGTVLGRYLLVISGAKRGGGGRTVSFAFMSQQAAVRRTERHPVMRLCQRGNEWNVTEWTKA
jgi:hypothetical protein